LLHDPSVPEARSEAADTQDAARQLNLKLLVLNASSEQEIDAAFVTLAEQHIDAVVVGTGPYLFSRRKQIIGLAARHAIPAVHTDREAAADGGLMSYGNNIT
jgi:putative ABC transport system substrate-binding protein